MSRAFKSSYGMPPVRYRHVIRTMDGMMRLLDGEPVTRVFQDVGFDDLTRFYQHFKRYTLSPPSKYRF
jgi:methylphosphotriester-DNA--protein-cysteine methyltransferase